MTSQRQQEFDLIRAKYGEICVDDSGQWFVVKHWPLVSGWSKRETALLVVIPPGYQVTPPDNFYTDNDLRLGNGHLPGNTAPNHHHLGQAWLQFSYHVERGDWRPHADVLKGHNLLTFLMGVDSRLSEVS